VPPQVMLPLLPNMKPSGQRLLSLCSTIFTLGHQNLGCDWQRYSGTRAQTGCPFYPWTFGSEVFGCWLAIVFWLTVSIIWRAAQKLLTTT
jgi:hypothetical protein